MPASWMKGTPAKSPALPDKVSLEILAAHAHELEAAGHADPALEYVIKFGPQQELDEWGQGLPLSDGDQDVIDGLVYLLGAPYQRLSDLVMSGMVTDDDVAAVKAVFPEAYKSLVKDFSVELVQAGAAPVALGGGIAGRAVPVASGGGLQSARPRGHWEVTAKAPVKTARGQRYTSRPARYRRSRWEWITMGLENGGWEWMKAAPARCSGIPSYLCSTDGFVSSGTAGATSISVAHLINKPAPAQSLKKVRINRIFVTFAGGSAGDPILVRLAKVTAAGNGAAGTITGKNPGNEASQCDFRVGGTAPTGRTTLQTAITTAGSTAGPLEWLTLPDGEPLLLTPGVVAGYEVYITTGTAGPTTAMQFAASFEWSEILQ
jgi:hypothetical protein